MSILRYAVAAQGELMCVLPELATVPQFRLYRFRGETFHQLPVDLFELFYCKCTLFIWLQLFA